MARPKDPELQARRRALVLDATVELLSEGSWTKMTLDAVARRAGVSKGVVTYWFDSKDALLVAAIERFHEQYAERLSAVAQSDAPPRERMRSLIELAFPSRAQVTREVRFQAEVWSFAKTNPSAAKRVREAYASFRIACQALLAIGKDAGYVTTPQTAGLERAAHALIDGLSLHIAFDPKANIAEIREELLLRLEQWFTTP